MVQLTARFMFASLFPAVLLSCSGDSRTLPVQPPPTESNFLEIAADDLAGYEFVEASHITEQTLVATHEVARALAMALNDATLRAQIRSAMEQSPYAESKLVLQEFVDNDTHARSLQDGLDRYADVSYSDFKRLLTEIPPMDFYLPWRLQLNVNNPVFDTYDLSGTRSVAQARRVGDHYDKSVAPRSEAILFLHPAEAKLAGDTIKPSGLTPAQDCADPESCGGTGGTEPIHRLVHTFFEYEYEGDAIGDDEIEFNFHLFVNGSLVTQDVLYYGSQSPHVSYSPNQMLWEGNYFLSSNRYIWIDIHEEDWPTDEYWGDLTISADFDFGQALLLIGNCGPYFNDFNDHVEDQPCHHGTPPGSSPTPIIRLTVTREDI